jgi:acetolactate synthase-1/2/3 large subunit
MPTRSIATDSVAEAWLALLAARGVEYLFANAGTDFPSIIEALAKPRSDDAAMPAAIVAPHENLAIGMAHGYAMVTGRPQAVMVHVNVGMANALCGLLNAAREQIPVIFTAGRTPIHEDGPPGARSLYIHWAQEMFDQAGMVREAVKWDYELRDGRQVETVVDRALSIAMSEPRGPVFIGLPREILAQKLEKVSFAEPARQRATAPGAPDEAAIATIAEALARAKNPLIVAASAGRDQAVPVLLADLAERFALPVVEFRPRYLNLPDAHPMHAGFEVDPFLDAADVILALDCDVPWIPKIKQPRPDCAVFQVGADPLFERYPMRTFAADIAVSAPVAATLRALGPALARAQPDERALAARRTALAAASRERRAAAIRAAEGQRGDARMDAAWMSLCLSRALPDDAIVVNEYPLLRTVTRFSQPGTYYGTSPVGGLGWGLPAALGAQLAARDRIVVATVGDGAYLFANPAACHQLSAACALPVLTIVFDNGGWNAVRRATQSMYPQGHALKANRPPLMTFDPVPRYEQLIAACGGWGERVERAADLPAALERALKVVREERRQALLSVAGV